MTVVNDGSTVRRNGIREWLVDGPPHRFDGLAIIFPIRSPAWAVDGKRHRLDAPAIINAHGSEEWWIKGKDMTDQVLKWRESMSIKFWQECADIDEMLFNIAFEGSGQ
jgi:hypothetical protein